MDPCIHWLPIEDALQIRPDKLLILWSPIRSGPTIGFVVLSDTDDRGDLVNEDGMPLMWDDYSHFVYVGQPLSCLRQPELGANRP